MTTEAAAAPSAPQETRKCRKCEEEKSVAPETWPYKLNKQRIYAAHGTICLACEKKRKAEYEEKRERIAADVKPKSDSKEKHDEAKAITAASKLDAALSLKAGSRALNEAAPGVLARILMWAEDEGHEQHFWAVEFLGQRIMPRKLFEELGGQAAGGGALQDRRPSYVIQILPAQLGAAEGRVVPGEVQSVEILPAPTE